MSESAFSPIAIIGRGCVLPGAVTPQALDAIAAEGRTVIRSIPEGRWRASRARILTADAGKPGVDGALTDRGAFVDGFDPIFDPSRFRLPAEEIATADRLIQWLLHAGLAALGEAGFEPGDSALKRAGAVVGNLSFPNEALTLMAEAHWLGRPNPVPPTARFNSGLPAHLLCAGLGLEAGGFALDAACASSLYAIHLACRRLQKGEADLMLAGAVNAVDLLMLHTGFTALGAISPTGQSRPFHAKADGLLPAEGAALVLLRRLEDAVAAGDRILGVIRGVGLSNDGRSGGFLAPSARGQEIAMRRAYEASGITPRDIGLIECHATGTQLGDATEIASTAAIFSGCNDVVIGSLKANLGHTVTVAGAAALIKVLGCIDQNLRPATPNAHPTIAALDGTPFRVLSANEPWRSGRRCAAISGFGFGGNNAHIIVDAWDGAKLSATRHRSSPDADVAIVAIGVRVGEGHGVADFTRSLFSGEVIGAAETIVLPMEGLRFPPLDLKHAHGQQTMLLAAAFEAVGGAGRLPLGRTAAIVGAQCDPEACRMPFRIRLAELAPGASPDLTGLNAMAASDVIGFMPNIPANRLNGQFDLGGPSFTIAGEELSGLRALDVARDMLATREIDAAIVGATDLSDEPIHRAALVGLGRDVDRLADVAVALVLKRLEDAQRDGNTVLAIINSAQGQCVDWQPFGQALRRAAGTAHAASTLLDVAAAAIALDRSILPPRGDEASRPWLPDREPRRVAITGTALGQQRATVYLRERSRSNEVAPLRPGWASDTTMDVAAFGGATLDELRSALVADHPLSHAILAQPAKAGPRLAIVRSQGQVAQTLRDVALHAIDCARQGRPVPTLPPEIAFQERPVGGDMAFVFTGSAAAYGGMGRDLLMALPSLIDSGQEKLESIQSVAGWVYDATVTRPSDYQQLCGSSLLCQVHAALTLEVLGLKPDAALGISSGETNALFAFGAWRNISGLLRDITEAHLYDKVLSGDYDAVKTYWQAQGIPSEPWESWTVWAPIDEVRAAARGTSAYIAIIYAPEECLLAGPASACAHVIESVGADRALRLNIQLACHVPAAGPAAELWRRLHSRPTTPRDDVRFYANGVGDSYTLSEAAIADMLTRQAIDTIDFPRTVRKAYADGVRIFVEHGPRAMCGSWIRSILGEGDYLTVSLDMFGRSSARQALSAVAALAAAGVPLELGTLTAALASDSQSIKIAKAQELVLPIRRPPINLQALALQPNVVPRPPVLLPPRHQRMAEDIAAVDSDRIVSRVAGGPVEFVARMHAALTDTHRAYLDRAIRLQSAFLDLAFSPQFGECQSGDTDAPANNSLPPEPEPRPVSTALSRADLEKLASGPPSAVWGERFAPLDHVKPLVRMPQPPLLLADRVIEIDAPPGILGHGSITTETEVKAQDWFLQNGHMPAGLTIEAGQADLLLVSWMGIDFHNRGERVYRLLGCDMVFHGNLPKTGDQLRYHIKAVDHSALGETRLFFFESNGTANGKPMLTVRNGQAGFFSAKELAAAEGVLWDGTSPPTPDDKARIDPAPHVTERRALSREDLAAFAEGRIADCFGPGFDRARTHTRSPAIPGGRMLLLHEVVDLAPRGGPWGRGYLRATWRFDPSDWFFAGHFLDDPCMPGTLMLEGCLQAMAILMTGMGLPLGRDGWRFEPVPDETYRLRCRGQATPANTLLTYEVFVDEVIDGPTPTLYADILGTVDGLKAFHCRRMGLCLVPDWPFETIPTSTMDQSARPCASNDGFPFDHRSLLACAVGRPSEAFGPAFATFEDGRNMPRLPAPPYHFITRVVSVDAPFLEMKSGGVATLEYDVPPDAWYFAEPGGAMPFAVLFEAGLQPCGWLGSYSGVPLSTKQELYCRNLEGSARVHAHVWPDSERLTITAKLTSLTDGGGIALIACHVSIACGDQPILDLDTKFGFFPAASLEEQVGLPVSENNRAAYDAEPYAAFVVRGGAWGAWVASDQLLMIDRVTGWWSDGGTAGLGLIRGEAVVDPTAWSFKAHFFQDPVQPGSLGVEAMLQLLKLDLLRRGLGQGCDRPEFDPILENEAVIWKYRGQVRPHNETVVTIVEIIERRNDAVGVVSKGRASMWADGIRIYEAVVGIRLRRPPSALTADIRELVIDPAEDRWLADHCPTFVIPAMPWMATIDLLMSSAADNRNASNVHAHDIRASGWLAFPSGPRRLRIASGSNGEMMLSVWREAGTLALSRFEPVATASFDDANHPVAIAPLRNGVEVHDVASGLDLYNQGHLFHGPGLRILRKLTRSSGGADGVLQLSGTLPAEIATRRWILLDGITHCIPGEALHLWVPGLSQDVVGYPIRARQLTWRRIGAITDQTVRAQVRVAGTTPDGGPSFAFCLTVLEGNQEIPWVEGYLDYAIFPKGPLGILSPADRYGFLVERRPCPGARLADTNDTGVTTLTLGALAESNWLPGTIATVYDCGTLSGLDLVEAVAVKDHVAAQCGLHPSAITWSRAAGLASYTKDGSVQSVALAIECTPDSVSVFATVPFGERHDAP